VLSWLINFFTGRTHQTKIDFTLSEVALLYSGVVQGSGICPLMFLVYINELIYVLEEHGIIVKLFADDVKMYAKITHDVDIVRLQRVITSFVEWASEWQLGISVEKCCLLNIGQLAHIPRLYLGNNELPIIPQTRDLGVVLCESLSPTPHVNDIVSKAHKLPCLFHVRLSHGTSVHLFVPI